jgi:hypothetical protein
MQADNRRSRADCLRARLPVLVWALRQANCHASPDGHTEFHRDDGIRKNAEIGPRTQRVDCIRSLKREPPLELGREVGSQMASGRKPPYAQSKLRKTELFCFGAKQPDRSLAVQHLRGITVTAVGPFAGTQGGAICLDPVREAALRAPVNLAEITRSETLCGLRICICTVRFLDGDCCD